MSTQFAMTITKVPGISLGIASLMVITEKEEAQKKKGGGQLMTDW